MAKAATKLKSGTYWDESDQKKQRDRRQAGRVSSIKDKTFGDLTKDEKDELLKALAIKFGMIQPG